MTTSDFDKSVGGRVRRWLLTSLAALSVLCLGGFAHAQSAAVGRVHAQKATRLAEQGKCKAAVFEYSKAYDILKDPAILFNRAECQRKLGRNQEALADYKQFLEQLPKAPNRENVEARIAELQKKRDLLPGSGVPSDSTTAPPAPVPPAPAPILDDDVSDDTAAEASNKDLTWTPPGQAATGVQLGRDEEPAQEVHEGSSVWVWVGLGLAVVAVGVGASVLILGKKDTDIPESSLGNYKF